MKAKLALIGLLLSSCVVVKHDCPKPETVLQDTLIWMVGPMTSEPIKYFTIDTSPTQQECYIRQ